MGGDFGPRVTVPASLLFASANPSVRVILAGDQASMRSACNNSASLPPNLVFVHTQDTVAMAEKPAVALRTKRQSSLWKVVELVAAGEADACVSAGNTGALMAIGRHLLKTYPGIARPAICKPMPTARGQCYMLDLGANVGCTAEHLLQFALMGSELAAALDGIEHPRVCLLNIGEETTKGNDEVRLAADLLGGNPYLNYVGFIEGDRIFQGGADVVVCDGFAGNVALKVSAGVVRFLAGELKAAIGHSWFTRLLGWVASPLLKQWYTRFDPGRYNGASLLGLQGAVIKSHGSADTNAFLCAIRIAHEQVVRQIPQRIHERLERVMNDPAPGSH